MTINNGFRMRAWYDIVAADFNSRTDVAGVRASQLQVEALIAREVARGIRSSRIVVAGFSQGGAVALYTGLRHTERLAGIIALSTYLIGADKLATEAASANRAAPIFMAHGTADPIVRFDWGNASRDALVKSRVQRRLAHVRHGAFGVHGRNQRGVGVAATRPAPLKRRIVPQPARMRSLAPSLAMTLKPRRV